MKFILLITLFIRLNLYSQYYSADDLEAFNRLQIRIENLTEFYERETGNKVDVKTMKFPNVRSMKEVAESLFSNEKYITMVNENLKKTLPIRRECEKIWYQKNAKVDDSASSEEAYLPDGRTKVKYKRIGVILDKSGSMKKYLPKLYAHINKNFKNPYLAIVEGCSLMIPRENSEWYFANKIPSFVNPFQKLLFIDHIPLKNGLDIRDLYIWNNYSAFQLYIKHFKVDTIYWFCDLQDPYEKKAVDEIKKLIIQHNVKLYLQVPSRNKLSKAILKLVKETKGKLIVKKL